MSHWHWDTFDLTLTFEVNMCEVFNLDLVIVVLKFDVYLRMNHYTCEMKFLAQAVEMSQFE